MLLAPLVIHPVWDWGVLVYEQPYGAFHLRNTFFLVPLDILQLVLVVLSVPKAIALIRSRRLSWAVIAALALVCVAIVSWAFHPSVPGTARILRWLAGAAVVIAASQLDRRLFRIHVGIPLIATCSVQAAIVLLQYFGANVASSQEAVFTATGTTQNAYVVAFILLVGLTVSASVAPHNRTRPFWIAGIGICSAGIATSTMRTALVGLLIAVAAYSYGLVIMRNRMRYGPILVATTVPFMLVAVAVGDPWLQRLLQTLGLGPEGSALEAVSTGRMLILRHGLAIATANPFVGVGPAREAIEAVSRFPGDYGVGVYSGAVPSVHFVPLLVAAEMGIAAGIAYLGYLTSLGWRAVRTSPEAVAVFASVGVFMFFDTIPYDRPSAIILVAIWMVALDRLSDAREMRTSHSA